MTCLRPFSMIVIRIFNIFCVDSELRVQSVQEKTKTIQELKSLTECGEIRKGGVGGKYVAGSCRVMPGVLSLVKMLMRTSSWRLGRFRLVRTTIQKIES